MNFPTLGGLQPMLSMPLNNATHTPLPHNPHNPIIPSRHAGNNAPFADRARDMHYRYYRYKALARTPHTAPGTHSSAAPQRRERRAESEAVQRRIHNIDQHLYQRWRALGSFDQTDGVAVTNDHQFDRTDRLFMWSMVASNQYSEDFPGIDENTFESFYSGVIARGLRWAVSERIADWSAADVLAAVCHHRDEKCDSQRMHIDRANKPNDVILDEAAQLYRLTNSASAAPASMAAIRATFFTALCDNWQDAALGQHLLPSMPIAPDHGRFRYDGGVLHAAVNLGLDAVVDRLYEKAPSLQDMTAMQPLMTVPGRHLAGQPDGLIDAQRRQDLIDAFLGASNIDTHAETPPRYSARPGAKQIGGVYLTRDELRKIVQETMRMLALDTQFTIGTPFHSIACTALRIGPLQGVDISNNPQSLLPDFAALNQRWHADPQTPTEPWLAAAYHLAQTSNVLLVDSGSGRTREQQIAAQVSAAFAPILSRIDDAETRKMPITWPLLTKLAQLQDQHLTPMQRRMCHHFRYLSDSVETIYYLNEQDLIAQLTAYLSQRVLAYAPQPACDEDALIRKIRHDKPDLAPANIATELAAAKRQFLNDLPADRRIQARARELLRLRALPYSTGELDAVIAMLTSNINRCPAAMTPEDVLDIADGMFSSPTIETVVAALASGDLKRILGLLPFIMPAYDVEEGLRAGDSDRALEGAVNLGKDALFTLLQGGVEAGLQRQLARDALLAGRMHIADIPPHEAASVALLHSMANHFPSLEAEQLSARRTLTDPDPFDLHAVGASSADASFDALRERVRNGESVTMQTPDRQYVQLVALNEQDRVVPALPTEGGWTECNLRGETVLGAPPILRSPESGKHYALTDMPGVPGGAGAITDADLQNRPTVRAAAAYLYAVSELPEVTRVDKNPQGLFRKLIQYTDTAAFREFEDFFVDTYKNSPTMRIMMNSALMRKTKSNTPPCTVHFDAQNAHWSGNGLYFMSDDALKRAYYLSPDGPVSFQRQRMWIHETVHLLTELSDLENIRKEASSHRGPVVYFTDRIQYEIATGMPTLSRMNYARAPFSKLDDQPLALARPEAERINTCRDWMIAEDNYLDKILGHDLRITAAAKILGQEVVNRATVRGALALRTHFKTMQTLIPMRVDAIVSATMRNLDSLSPFASHRPISNTLLRSLISKSKSFRQLCIAWLAHHRPVPLTFELFDFNSVPGWRKTTLAHHLAADGNTMWINANPIYYFTAYGNEKMSLARKIMGSLIEVIMRETLPALPLPPLADPYAERGLPVLLENRVMAEIGETATPRLCAALSEREDAYLRTLTAVARAVRSEDAFLKRVGKTGLEQR